MNFPLFSAVLGMYRDGEEANSLLYSPEVMVHGSGKAGLY